jgi:transcriptional regulator with PAS, ATPase and Fis domain
MQGKLLRVIQDKTIYKVGSSQAIRVNTRLIVATNKDLPQLVQKGLFREDLYYRINVIDIPVPPLRERGDDVFALVHYFLEKFSQDLDRPAPRFSDEALRRMRTYAWPGNVRELENLIQKLVIITDGDTIQDADLPAPMRFRICPEKRLDQSLADFETEYIREVLASVGGNKTRAAEILKIDRKTLRDRLK